MEILGLTGFDQIRGVLTVSPADLPDSVLIPYGIEDDLAAELMTWVPGYASLTDENQLRLLRLFSKYFCASIVAGTAQVFVLTKASDGSNEGQRSDADGWAWMSNSLKQKAAGYKAQLLTALGTSAAGPRITLVSRVTPTRDPITEAR